MPESFLILLAGGVMLAAAVCNPHDVTLHWLRLAGILALSMAGLSFFFFVRRSDWLTPLPLALYASATALILAQLAFVQVDRRSVQRLCAIGAAAMAVAAGAVVLPMNPAIDGPPALRWTVVALSAAGVAALCGMCLMDMLLGHAYLTASKMTLAPFLRLNRTLGVATLVRTILAVGATTIIESHRPQYMFWAVQGLYVGTRWLVGLLVPGIFIVMAHACIRRRSTQSATGILYVAGVLIFIGEMIALYLVRETGLPF